MGRRIQVKALHKEQPDIGLYVQALIALARQIQAREEASRSATGTQATASTEASHD